MKTRLHLFSLSVASSHLHCGMAMEVWPTAQTPMFWFLSCCLPPCCLWRAMIIVLRVKTMKNNLHILKARAGWVVRFLFCCIVSFAIVFCLFSTLIWFAPAKIVQAEMGGVEISSSPKSGHVCSTWIKQSGLPELAGYSFRVTSAQCRQIQTNRHVRLRMRRNFAGMSVEVIRTKE